MFLSKNRDDVALMSAILIIFANICFVGPFNVKNRLFIKNYTYKRTEYSFVKIKYNG